MAFRLHDEKPQYRLADGSLAAAGTLTFTITGTSTAKSVYAEPALSTNLGNVITLDSDARHSEDVWLAEDAAYRVQLKDADGVSVWVLDNVRSLDTSVSANLPDAADGTEGQALLTDGTSGGWYFGDIPAIPSQTGNAGKYLGTDGESLVWTAFADDTATLAITSQSAAASGYEVRGDVMECWGSGTAPSNGSGLTSTVSVTFALAMGGTPYHISITPVLSSGVSSNSPSGFPTTYYNSPSSAGFTAGIFVGEESNGGTDHLSSSTPFTYRAIGPAP